MSLRIRRGTESQRQTTTFDLGEIAYTTDSKKLFVGDGVTVGGVNVLKTTVGAGLSWNDSTQQLDISGTNLSTSNITEGTNLYFTTDRAQDASASLLTHNVGHSNISFTYDDTLNKILATVSLGAGGIEELVDDPSPSLGGDLSLNSHNLTGTGNININGNITANTLNGKLGSNLDLNTKSISGTGNIIINGNITATTLNGKLGSNLDLNTKSISGTGNIDITGTIVSTSIGTSSITLNESNIFSDGLTINSGAIDMLTVLGITRGTDIVNSPNISLLSANGDINSPSALSPNDIIGSLLFNAYKETEDSIYVTTSGIISQLDSDAVMSTIHPSTTITVMTGNNTENYNEFTFDSKGVFNAPVIKATSYSTGSFPANPEKGWIIFNSTSNHFYGYNGTDWVAFTGP
jgi:hypothetical protein